MGTNQNIAYIYIENKYETGELPNKRVENGEIEKARICLIYKDIKIYSICSPVLREIIKINWYDNGVVAYDARYRYFNHSEDSDKLFVDCDNIDEEYTDFLYEFENQKLDTSILKEIKEIRLK